MMTMAPPNPVARKSARMVCMLCSTVAVPPTGTIADVVAAETHQYSKPVAREAQLLRVANTFCAGTETRAHRGYGLFTWADVPRMTMSRRKG